MQFRLTIIFLFSVVTASAQNIVSKDTLLMGSAFSFTAVHENTDIAWQAIHDGINEVVRIEAIISSWKSTSETSRINQNAGIKPIKVSKELFDLIFRAKKISKISNGYFDISFASIDKVWKFDGSEIKIPTKEQLSASVEKINYENIVLNQEEQTVFLKEKGMKIGFGAIGKGYAADKAKLTMKKAGIDAGLVNAGGDIISWGNRPDGSPWIIGITNPKKKDEITSYLNISDKAVVTSGNYEKYVTIEGKKYCHIINPKSGWPVTGITSVTVITENAELADALSTTVFILGEKEGMNLLNHLDGVEGIIVNDHYESHYSKNIQLKLIENESN